MSVSSPHQIGKYEIEREIGRGGMGTVYLAQDPVLGRRIALKTLFAGEHIDVETRQRFLREARSAARLQHPNIITIFELGEFEDSPYIAMEYLEGLNLAEAVEQAQLTKLFAKLDVIEQLCDGLAHAHKQGVIHRDIKPTNIIILADGTVKVVDFGIARFEEATFATRAGEVLGTPHYMAPEQFTGGEIDHRVDVWAVGVILYELLTGRRPFTGDTVPALVYQIVHAPMPPLNPDVDQIPMDLVPIVKQALAKDRLARYQDLQQLADDLADVKNSMTGARPTEATQRLVGPPVQKTFTLEPSRPTTGTIGQVVTTPATPTRQATTKVSGTYQEAGIFGEAAELRVIAVSPDETMLAIGGIDGSIRLWDLTTRMKTATLRSRMHLRTGHGALTKALAFSTDSSYLAAGHLDGAIYIWQPQTGLELEVALRHEGAVGGVAFSPDTSVLASGGMDATLKLWEMPAILNGEARRLLRRQPADVTSLAVDPHGRYVATGHTNRCIRVQELITGRLIETLHGNPNPPNPIALSADGNLLACGNRDGTVRVFALESRAQTCLLQGHSRAVASIVFHPDGQHLISVANDNALAIWDLGSGLQTSTLWGGADESFVSVRTIQEGQVIICGLNDGRVRLWFRS
jgi:serine/threonine protein kinase